MPKDQGKSTRDQIIHMLKMEGAMTVSEIAKQLEITEMAVRRHLNTLERDNLIQSTLQRQAMGRPTHVYSLSEKAEQFFPKSYQDIALDFLQDIREMEGEEKVLHLFRRREKRLYDLYSQQMEGKSIDQRLEELAEIQNEKGYMVELKKDPETGAYIFVEKNCPISDVAKEFTHACNCELSLFQKVLPDAEVIQNECMAKGGEKCKYTIREK
ncbi:MAG: transcriptional regulator [Bacillaceae bacterium]|nr:transcriptional regulator [Bacillaceae bacterium]